MAVSGKRPAAVPAPPKGDRPGVSAHLRMDAEAAIIDLIGEVYDAALDEKLWPELAPRIARTFDSTSTAVRVRYMRDGRLEHVEGLALTANYDHPISERYESYYAARDVWVERARQIGVSKVVASKDIISDAEFERTEVCQDLCRPLGYFYMVGAIFPISGDAIGVIGIHRPRQAGGYDERDKRRVARFLPHLQRALEIGQRLATLAIDHGAALDALERTRIATLVVSADGRLLYANHRAEAILRAGDAISLIGGRLAARDRGAAARLGALIRDAASTARGNGHGAGGVLSVPRGERLPLTLLVAPFRPARDGLGAPIPAAIVFLRDPEGPSPRNIALQGLFGLTAAEATVAAGLANGAAVDGLAARLGISLNTAKTHLKNIFAKTGTSRQAQLVALILSSVAILLDG